MSLKELTAASHAAAENTKFMKSVFVGKMPADVWTDFTYQKSLIYNAIEGMSGALGLLTDIQDIRRAFLLWKDYQIMSEGKNPSSYNQTTIDYYKYLMNLFPNKERVAAHLYTWHLGDLHGGQMIKKVIPGSHLSLEFNNRPELIAGVRSLLNDTMADEANVAFEWAIRMMKEYDDQIDL
jgi:heme oxygenase